MYAVPMNRRPRSRQGGTDLSIRERAYLHIQQLLLSGKLEAGSSVSEQLLARDLGSSRTPIREAMNQLAAEGLLEQSPNGGMIVAQLGREDIIELYELREALEVYAVGKMRARRYGQWIAIVCRAWSMKSPSSAKNWKNRRRTRLTRRK